MRLAAGLFALLFAGIALLVAGDSPLLAIDRTVNPALAGLGGPALVPLFQAISAMAGGVATGVLAGVAALAFWAKGFKRAVLGLALAWAGSIGTIVVVKPLVARARPEPLAGIVETGLSFPSGSTTLAAGVYGVIALLLARTCRTGACRWMLALAALAVVVLVGLSRLALGVHYLSDVVAGALAGGVWALIGALAAGAPRPRAPRSR
ncbi:MAG: phosphatase PAP2 family protein [Pseudomonadota bacterium]